MGPLGWRPLQPLRGPAPRRRSPRRQGLQPLWLTDPRMQMAAKMMIAGGIGSAALVLAALLPFSPQTHATPPASRPMVRLAELEIDAGQLDAYKAILAEEQEASVRVEPGVLALHSVALAGKPTQIRLLEVYASQSAYEAHLQTSHFIRYKTLTEKMVKCLTLMETTPILLCAKANGPA